MKLLLCPADVLPPQSRASDPALAAQLGQAARERVCANFSMEKSIGNLWRVIEGCMDGRR